MRYDTTSANGGLGHFVIGTFIANAAGSQTLTFVPDPASFAQINGLQLRVLSPVLTSAYEFSTDSVGNGTGEFWSTINNYTLFFKQGNAFLNAANGSLFVPLAPGANTFELRGDGTGTGDQAMYGLNLFFGRNVNTPVLSVYGTEGASGNPTPPFMVNSAPRTYGAGGMTPGAGTASVIIGNYQVTLTDYYWQSAYLQNINEVSPNTAVPGGGNDFTGHVTLTVTPLNTQITGVTPSTLPAGSPSTTILVNGQAFVPGSVVQWNGMGRTTTFLSSTELQAAIPASDLLRAGNATITVATPGQPLSNAVNVVIAPPSIQTTFALSRDPLSREVLVDLTLSNSGGGYATGESLTAANVGSVGTTAPALPLQLGTIPPGGSVTTRLRFAGTIPAGANFLRLAGTGSSGSFGGTYRITVP